MSLHEPLISAWSAFSVEFGYHTLNSIFQSLPFLPLQVGIALISPVDLHENQFSIYETVPSGPKFSILKNKFSIIFMEKALRAWPKPRVMRLEPGFEHGHWAEHILEIFD